MKKKVCMVVPSFSAKGGITSVVNGYRGSNLEKDFDIKYIETYCDGSKLSKFKTVLKAYFSFINILFFWHPDIVHIHSSFGGSFYRKLPFIVLSSWMNVPIINHIHGSYYNEFFFNAPPRKKKLISKTYNRCSAIIALSEEARKQLKQITHVKIEVVENYGIINVNAINNRMKRKCHKNVLFLGFITEKKGCFDIPKILETVKDVIPDVKFIIGGVGEINLLKKTLKKSIRENIEFPGWVVGEKKDFLLKQADVFFLPSYSEGMPMSILDAMGYGLPIVSTNVGGITKIVHNGENGFVCEPGDIKGLSNSIIKLLNDDKLLKSSGEKSVAIINNGYSLDIHIKKIKTIYGE